MENDNDPPIVFDIAETQPGGLLYSEDAQRIPTGADLDEEIHLILLDQWHVQEFERGSGLTRSRLWSSLDLTRRPFFYNGTSYGPLNNDPALSPQVIQPTILERDTTSGMGDNVDVQLIGNAYSIPTMGPLGWDQAFYNWGAPRRQRVVQDAAERAGEGWKPARFVFRDLESARLCLDTAGRYHSGEWVTAISTVFLYFPGFAILLHDPAPAMQADFERWISAQTPRLGLENAVAAPYSWSEAMIAPPDFEFPLVRHFYLLRNLQGRSGLPLSLDEMYACSAAYLVSLRGGPISMLVDAREMTIDDEEPVEAEWWDQ